MSLVVDANILIAELIRKRGQELIVHPALELYMAQMVWEETCYELSKRVEKMAQKRVFSQEIGQKLLTDAIALAETKVSVIPHEVYASYETIALLSHSPHCAMLLRYLMLEQVLEAKLPRTMQMLNVDLDTTQLASIIKSFAELNLQPEALEAFKILKDAG